MRLASHIFVLYVKAFAEKVKKRNEEHVEYFWLVSALNIWFSIRVETFSTGFAETAHFAAPEFYFFIEILSGPYMIV